eukprot:Opistho-2@44140
MSAHGEGVAAAANKSSIKSNNSLTHVCVVCGTVAGQRCGNCQIARYCSRTCQKTHWSAGHRDACVPATPQTPSASKSSDGGRGVHAGAPALHPHIIQGLPAPVNPPSTKAGGTHVAKTALPPLSANGRNAIALCIDGEDMDSMFLNIIQNLLRADGINAQPVEVAPKRSLVAKIASLVVNPNLRMIIFIGDSRDDFSNFGCAEVKALIVPWVGAGGALLMQGERPVTGLLREWFRKPWTMEGDYYRRTDFRINRACDVIASDAEGIFRELAANAPASLNQKTCMLSHVAPGECLYTPAPGATTQSSVFAPVDIDSNMCPFAVAAYGNGHIAFVGDVNYEPMTVHVVRLLVRAWASRTGVASIAVPVAGAGAESRGRTGR